MFVVLRYSDSQFGVIVDSLIGQQEIVVKALDRFVSKEGGITGASILGTGKVVLILDVASLIRITKSLISEEKEPALTR